MEGFKFNINGYVKVRLTEIGERELKMQHQALQKQIPQVGDYKPRKPDSKGYTKWQMYDLMESLGHLCTLGSQPPFETEIIILE